MRRFGLVVAAAMFVGAVGCSSSQEAGTAPGKGAPEATAPSTPAEAGADVATRDVILTGSGVEDHEVWGPGAYVVKYKITNAGRGPADYFVQLEFLDKDGDVLGTTGVGAEKLGEGKSHAGDTAPVSAEIRNGQISDIRSVKVATVERTPA
ncbi:hypothetical protein C0R05_32090 [Streptomyces albidoflavus]|nr:hypothetical protein C0R05_32090 [Streptomyces albidoflavus]